MKEANWNEVDKIIDSKDDVVSKAVIPLSAVCLLMITKIYHRCDSSRYTVLYFEATAKMIRASKYVSK